MKNLAPTTQTLNEQPEVEMTEKEQQWEENHATIGSAMIDHLFQYGTMPSKVVIAKQTGLSRQAVHRHLKAYTEGDEYGDKDSFGFMTNQVIAQVLKAALHGDLKAAKLYLETAKDLRMAAGQVSKPSNYIQINKTVINQQIIQQLKPQELKQIEQIITKRIEEKR